MSFVKNVILAKVASLRPTISHLIVKAGIDMVIHYLSVFSCIVADD